MKKTQEFKTESKQLLDLMIHSIYSNKEIFLRELISNASDALDKRRFLALQDKAYEYKELEIDIKIDAENRTLTISDDGIGMTLEDLENNLGTIAHSGSKAFLEEMAKEGEAKPQDIIGQFGVGFYSSFIVADTVEVLTKAPNSKGLKWTSTGESEYSVEEADVDNVGTTIILHLREGEEYDKFLDQHVVQDLIKKHSDYIKYPIYMDITREEPVLNDEGEPEEGKYETVTTREKINSQIALWKRRKNEVTEEEYNQFYMTEFEDYQAPLDVIHSEVEGLMSYNALLFIPKKRSYDFYQQTYKKGLALYSKGVLIDERVEGLLSEAFRFVRGLVDSSDISLNISREMLQQDKQVEKLAQTLESKIKNELAKMQKRKREQYDEFYEEFGMQLVYGMYDNYGAKKDMLKDLIMYKTSKSEGKYVTLAEYVERMKEDQKAIYFVTGSSIEQIEQLPQMEQLLENDIEVLYFTNDVDEFAMNVLAEYDEKPIQSISQGDFDFTTDDQKKELETKQEESKDLLTTLKETLEGKVDDIRLTTRLKNSAVCLVGGEGLSLEMEKVLSQMPDGMSGIKAERILEVNPEHPLFNALQKAYDRKDDMSLYANLLYNQALLIEGLPIENPVEYANEMSRVMVEALSE